MKPSDGANAPRSRQSDTDGANRYPPLLPETNGDESEFAQSLQTFEQSLKELKDRYIQVQRDEKRREELRSRTEQIKQEVGKVPTPALRKELKQLRQQLDEVEVALESRLFTFKPFWQAVRFGGLGLLIGWLLKSCTG